MPQPPQVPHFPYTTLFRSGEIDADQVGVDASHRMDIGIHRGADVARVRMGHATDAVVGIDLGQAVVVHPDAIEHRFHLLAERSEEHTSETPVTWLSRMSSS